MALSPPVQYLPIEGKPWRLTMGLRPLDPSAWLEVDARRGAELADKHRLLRTVPDRVVGVLPGSQPAGAELLAAVVDHLDRHHPGLVAPGADGTLVDTSTGEITDPAALHPVDAAGRLVQEDLCLMERRGGAWVLTAASLCFPSRWSLASKLGSDISTIHGPVAGYGESLAGPTERFFDRLRTDRGVWRLNWTLIDRPDLHQPAADHRRHTDGDLDPGRDLWFRVERQTLRRLTDRSAVVFTIRTYVTALDELVTARPEAADALLRTLPTVPADAVAYKGWEGIIGPLIEWLSARPRREGGEGSARP